MVRLVGVVALCCCVVARASGLMIRGVNLGGWLVLEQWIKPSLFAQWDAFDPTDPKDQWTYCAALGKKECLKRLTKHWETWVTEKIFDDLNEAGITHVRVPIGHWILGNIAEDEPYTAGEWPFFARACGWAQARGIKVWVDLHTAPGSQNGFDNSGKVGDAMWSTDMRLINRTLDIISEITAQIHDDSLEAITGFGLLNEPSAKTDYWRMLHYYDDAYHIIRRTLGPDVAVYIGDMFNPQSFNGFWHGGYPIEAENVFLDTHIYACFVDDLKAMTPEQHVHQVCHFEREHIGECCWAEEKPTNLRRFIGEWTAAYDETPSPEFERDRPHSRPLTPARKKFLEQYVLAQMMVFEATSDESGKYLDPKDTWWHLRGGIDLHGWFFWNFRMELDAYREWDYLRGVKEGWIPKLTHNVTVDDQFHTSCRQLEEAAQTCTDGVVDPYPPLEDWKGIPCVVCVAVVSLENLPRRTADENNNRCHPLQVKLGSHDISLSIVIGSLVLIIVGLLIFYRRTNPRKSCKIPVSVSKPQYTEIVNGAEH